MEYFGVRQSLAGLQVAQNKERETGIEPATSSLGSWHSTAELLPLTQTDSYSFSSRNQPIRQKCAQ
jgi:hypothetical protein